MLIQTTKRHKRVNINPRKVKLVYLKPWDVGDLVALKDGRQYQVMPDQSALLVSYGRTNTWEDIRQAQRDGAPYDSDWREFL
ncbi:hypothetical protein HWN39_10595 [Lactobacillus rhamnosus]|uniref:Uncharacterized protein n=1 Tax=Lacticaseibacillus rhamnosus TaxID=47715 RepID=A0A7Y7QGW4_LACRH|nr:hypothetical protein [Lacticaseibacillus rhamnosus]NVO88926.1 hypothetical protein [Lacticaseibacillus rhamnosus]